MAFLDRIDSLTSAAPVFRFLPLSLFADVTWPLITPINTVSSSAQITFWLDGSIVKAPLEVNCLPQDINSLQLTPISRADIMLRSQCQRF